MRERKKSKKETSGPNKDEFTYGFNSSVSGKHLSSVSKHSRKDKITECRLTVTDKITGAEEIHVIPAGNYSKKEMQQLRANAFEAAVLSLYKKRK
jgi:hypothetical protein